MRISAALLASTLLLSTSSLHAQPISTPSTEPAQAADLAPLMPLEEVRSIVYGEDQSRSEEALEALEAYAERGDAAAMQILGDVYALGKFADQDKDRAVEYYERSIEAGGAFAAYRLAEAYRSGSLVDQDQTKAVELYRSAAKKGVEDAKVKLAEAMLFGDGIEQDADQGLAALNELAVAGNQTALNTLGNVYSMPSGPVDQDGEKAVSFFDQAAKAGNLFAKVRLAELYADGEIVPEDNNAALQNLQEAVDGGLEYARLVLATGHLSGRFGDESDPSLGLSLLTELAEGGNSQALVTLANAFYWGSGAPEDPNRAVSENGNVAATQRLAMLLRDAPGERIDENLAEARTLISSTSENLPPAVRTREYALLAAADARKSGEFAQVTQFLTEAPAPARPEILRAMFQTNPNAFVYVAQTKLRDRGVYNGPLNGLLTGSTIRAINTICDDVCRRGPMRQEAVQHLSDRLAE